MPTNLIQPYTLSIEDSAGYVGAESKVKLYNRTSGETISATFDSNSQALVDLAEFSTSLADGDVIEISVLGLYEDTTTHTVSKTSSDSGSADITLTTVAVSSSLVSVSL